MLLTNHTLTGVVLGLTIDNPVVLAPVAVASHLALDVTPHFGIRLREDWYHDRRFIIFGTVDVACSTAVTVAACLIWPQRAVNILVGVIGADLPDFTYIPLVLFGKARMERWLPFYRPMINFLSQIQWYERPPGLITEVVWAVAMVLVLNARLPS
ncbi:MAG TPA: hypothetical protein VI322_04215 [Candidatus Saccharimonadia bacterium]